MSQVKKTARERQDPWLYLSLSARIGYVSNLRKIACLKPLQLDVFKTMDNKVKLDGNTTVFFTEYGEVFLISVINSIHTQSTWASNIAHTENY